MNSFSITALVAEQKKDTATIFTKSYRLPLQSIFFLLTLLTFLISPILLTPSLAASTENTNVLNADLYRMPIPIQLQLVAHTQRYVNSIANNVIPNFKQKNVVKRGDEFIARYLEIDTSSATMEALPLEQGKSHKAIIAYHELEYQCRGATKEAALNGEFFHKKTRRLIEILQYRQGRWR